MTGLVLTRVGVSAGDIFGFSLYVALGLALPGFALWRLLAVDARARAEVPVVSDVVFGTALAYAVHLGVYLVCAGAGYPALAALWPLLPVAVSLLPGARPRVWHRKGARQPVWWSWSMAAVLLFSLQWLARQQWAPSPLTGDLSRHPYVDMPYHLSLVTALQRQVPADLPFVQGEPLYYHWFVHADLAATARVTGIEPSVLLERLGMLPMVAVVLLGAALLTQQVAQSAWAGLVAPALLTIAASPQVPPEFGMPFLSSTIFLSPTTTFAHVLLVGCTAAMVTLLGHPPEGSSGRQSGAWVAAGCLIFALSGAKGSATPIVAAGLVAVLVMTGLLRRRWWWRPGLLLVMTVIATLVAQRFVYGASTQGLGWGPLGLSGDLAQDLGMTATPDEAPWRLRAVLAVLFVFSLSGAGVGVVGLFTRHAWRDPRAHFLVGASAAGIGATLCFTSEARNQLYFIRLTPALLAVASAWGLAVLCRRVDVAVRPRVLAVSSGFGAALAYAAGSLAAPRLREFGGDPTVSQLVTPVLVAVGLVLVAGAVAGALSRSKPRLRHVPALAIVGAVLGLGLPYGVGQLADLLAHPGLEEPAALPESTATVGLGGVSAARWLRDHSTDHDVVATNAHCRRPNARVCDARAFWIAGFTERQVLLEGWAYTSRTARDAARLGLPHCCIPFWDAARQEDNDRAFTSPSTATLARLRTTYGVDWLFVDTRFPVELESLESIAEVAHQEGDYVVLRVGAPS